MSSGLLTFVKFIYKTVIWFFLRKWALDLQRRYRYNEGKGGHDHKGKGYLSRGYRNRTAFRKRKITQQLEKS